MRLTFFQAESAKKKRVVESFDYAQDGSEDGERSRTIDPERALSEIEGRVEGSYLSSYLNNDINCITESEKLKKN
jgi:hypothetical protein